MYSGPQGKPRKKHTYSDLKVNALGNNRDINQFIYINLVPTSDPLNRNRFRNLDYRNLDYLLPEVQLCRIKLDHAPPAFN